MTMVYKTTVLALFCLIYNMVEADVIQRMSPECKLPRRTGYCLRNIPSYYYNTATGECTFFLYSGCGGNLNNFKTLDECYSRCVCSQNPKSGNGTLTRQRFYFNVNEQTCKPFTFTGENGNQNRFRNRRQCEEKCETYPVRQNCDARPDPGYGCENSPSKQFYFDYNCNCCHEFRYLGCGGNSNRFLTRANCENTCTIVRPPKPEGIQPPRCSLQADYGNCTEELVRYHFSTVADKCIPFVYSGCGGNKNNFDTLDKCNSRCVDLTTNASASFIQSQEIIKPAASSIAITDTPVVKGGDIKNIVDARMNDLDSLIQLARDTVLVAGVPSSPTQIIVPEQCLPSPSKGECAYNLIRYYYDKETMMCKPFTWSGCGGNSNRFYSQIQCESLCIPS